MGYNGAPAGVAHCEDVGCDPNLVTGRCRRAVHAEINCLVRRPHVEFMTDMTYELWCTHHPCDFCLRAIEGRKAIRVVNFFVDYSNEELVEYLSNPLNIREVKLVKHPLEGPYQEP